MKDQQYTAFIPPYPKRFEVPPPLLTRMQLARRSFLSIWCEADFSHRIATLRVLNREVAIINAPNLVKQAFQDNHPLLQRKSPQMRHALDILIGDGLFISDGKVWKERRKIVAPIIHGSKVPNFAPVMIEVMEECRAKWQALGEGAEIDALSEFAELTSEVICRTIFGQKLGTAYASEIVQGFAQFQEHVSQLDILSMLGVPDWVPRRHSRRVRKAAARVRGVLDLIIDRYAEDRSDTDTSVIGGLLDARDSDGNPLTRETIRNEAAVIFMAGHETTANTLAWAWYLLSQSAPVYDQLKDELERVVGNRPIQFSDVSKLTYTRAVVDETLRLYPPVPILAREAMGEVKIGHRTFKKGSILMVVAWLLHRNPKLWPDADAFRPERFLDELDPTKSKRPDKYAYVPFAMGPRICAGLVFGQTEAILAVAVLAQRFRPELAPGTDVQPVCRLTLRPGENLPMILRQNA